MGDRFFSNLDMTNLMDNTFNKAMELRVKKGAEYAGDVEDDALANFRRNGKDAGVSMEVCWRIYAGKHWDAISQYIRDANVGNFNRVRMEPVEGRVDDLIVYLILLKAMMIERRKDAPKVSIIDRTQLNQDPNPWAKPTGDTNNV